MRAPQSAGEWERRRVDVLADAAKAEDSAGSYETPVSYEGMDGVYLAMQGKDREYAEGVVAEFYAVDAIQRRVFNSDGANCLQRDMMPGYTYQLDLFHRNKAVRTYLNDPDLQELVRDLLNKRQVTQALEVIEASIESTLDPKEQKNRRDLYTYFHNHRHALIPYYRRKSGKVPPPNKGQKPARMDSMESNIFTIIGNWMKHNRTCWSVAAAHNLAALLALHHTGHLRRVLRGWEAHGDPRGNLTVTGPISAAKMDDRDGGEGLYPPSYLCSLRAAKAAAV